MKDDEFCLRTDNCTDGRTDIGDGTAAFVTEKVVPILSQIISTGSYVFPSYFIETEMNLIKVEQQFDGLQFNFNNGPPDFPLYWSILLN